MLCCVGAPTTGAKVEEVPSGASSLYLRPFVDHSCADSGPYSTPKRPNLS